MCGSKLPPRTEAWFDDVRGTTTCVSCERLNRPDPLPVRPIHGESLPTPDISESNRSQPRPAPSEGVEGGAPGPATPPAGPGGERSGGGDPHPAPGTAPERPRIRSVARSAAPPAPSVSPEVEAEQDPAEPGPPTSAAGSPEAPTAPRARVDVPTTDVRRKPVAPRNREVPRLKPPAGSPPRPDAAVPQTAEPAAAGEHLGDVDAVQNTTGLTGPHATTDDPADPRAPSPQPVDDGSTDDAAADGKSTGSGSSEVGLGAGEQADASTATEPAEPAQPTPGHDTLFPSDVVEVGGDPAVEATDPSTSDSHTTASGPDEVTADGGIEGGGSPDAATPVGPLVAELPFADGGAPLSWKGELFQGPPLHNAEKVEENAPVPSPRFDEVSAAVAAQRPEAADRIGSVLESAEDRGLIWLPGRRTPGGFTVDHLAISPNGIWVVASEPEPAGRVEKRDVGDWFTPEPRLFVGEDDHTHVVRRLDSVDESLGRALRGTILADVPRYKVLCFVDLPPGWLDRPFPFDEVWVTWSHHLVEPMLSTVEYQRDELADMAEVLAATLEPGR